MKNTTYTNLFEDELQTKVLELLNNGHANAILLKDIQKRLQVKDERKIRIAIEKLRREGWQIIIPATRPYGYFIAENQAELDEYDHYMRSRMIEEYRTYKIVKRATKRKIQKEYGQLSLI